jgi:hypothetical protein
LTVGLSFPVIYAKAHSGEWSDTLRWSQRARGNKVAYRDLVSRYRAMAKSLGFEGHIAWAEAMI